MFDPKAKFALTRTSERNLLLMGSMGVVVEIVSSGASMNRSLLEEAFS